MLKFFTTRDDENESLLGALTEDEGDSPSLMDAKHHWLSRPCLLMLKDGDMTKPGHIRSEAPTKALSDGVLSPGGARDENPLYGVETLRAVKESPTSHLESQSQKLMRQLEEGTCTVTTISTWGARQFEEASTPLVLSPSRASWSEAEVEESKPQTAPSKEESVIEEKELEESGQDQTCTDKELEEKESDCGDPQSQSKANPTPCTNEHEEANKNTAQYNSEGGAEGDSTLSPVSPLVDPDNELLPGPVGILSRERGLVLGDIAPVWIPDAQALVCMKCEVRFTFTKRRHHCRACGKVFCSVCSNLKFRLTHLDGKEGRVCRSCHSTLVKSTPPRGKRRVWFADEILPCKQSESAPTTPIRGPTFSPLMGRAMATPVMSPTCSPQTRRRGQAPQESVINEVCGPYGWSTAALVNSHISSSANLIPLDGLPPILTSTGVKGDYTVEERPSEMLLIQELESGRLKPLVFVLNANLLAMVKLVNYVNRKCWCVTSKGMHAVGQVEVVVLLQCVPEEKSFPRDIFSHLLQLYTDALTGKVLSNLGLSLFSSSFLGSEEHAGFLYVRSTLQSLQGLPLPSQPYLFGLLVHRAEVAWAKAFPLRLMLRLGAEYRFYPCPLYSVRFRKALFGQTGHTIMKLLVDFRNYRYTLPVVPGLTVDLEAQRTCITIPTNGYSELMKVLNKSNEHVLAMGACFNEAADSHLICVQGEDGQYQTQAISIHNQPRKVTGSCFFVFSSALKASSGYLAKSSIVEDGLMVQITVETMAELRRSLREMKDFTITCGRLDQSESQELVQVQWLQEKSTLNKGIISPIDGKSMESICSMKMFQRSEYKANGKVIRWTEVFFLQKKDHPKGVTDTADHNRLTERLARAFCLALCPYLKLLKEDGMAKLGLRITLDSQQVGFLAGSNGLPLPAQYLSALDSVLVPVIHSRGRKRGDGPMVMELIFYILENVS
ncbi:zinc finger FYVE domain-containing protein 9 [Osmerus eperlanus]|uniref:zinc finger FYVE domain-containing protein 9 n=1 Tax=Osmerus eperlanus TaxID=29151 RepID=UPI002E111683